MHGYGCVRHPMPSYGASDPAGWLVCGGRGRCVTESTGWVGFFVVEIELPFVGVLRGVAWECCGGAAGLVGMFREMEMEAMGWGVRL